MSSVRRSSTTQPFSVAASAATSTPTPLQVSAEPLSETELDAMRLGRGRSLEVGGILPGQILPRTSASSSSPQLQQGPKATKKPGLATTLEAGHEESSDEDFSSDEEISNEEKRATTPEPPLIRPGSPILFAAQPLNAPPAAPQARGLAIQRPKVKSYAELLREREAREEKRREEREKMSNNSRQDNYQATRLSQASFLAKTAQLPSGKALQKNANSMTPRKR